MLTGMTDEDWDVVLRVFRASRSRRGDKGRDDRKFLEALHYFSVHNITWRALPAEYGPWNSVWKRFWRLSRAGVFEAFFEALAAISRTAHLVQMFNSTIGGRMSRRREPKGAAEPGARAVAGLLFHQDPPQDRSSRPAARLRAQRGPGERQPDVRGPARPRSGHQARAAVGDKGYANRKNRAAARDRAICPVIPYKAKEKNPPRFLQGSIGPRPHRARSQAQASNESLSNARKRSQLPLLRRPFLIHPYPPPPIRGARERYRTGARDEGRGCGTRALSPRAARPCP